jgi:hypothetical protein
MDGKCYGWVPRKLDGNRRNRDPGYDEGTTAGSRNSDMDAQAREGVGITLTCDIIGSITGNAGVRKWQIGTCGHEQGRLKWQIGTTRRRIKELEFTGERRIKELEFTGERRIKKKKGSRTIVFIL